MDRTGYGVYFPPGNNGNTVDSCDIGNLRMIRNTPQSVNPDEAMRLKQILAEGVE
jgi:hypothetical protein